MRDIKNKLTEKAKNQTSREKYTSPRLVKYGTISGLTKGSNGSRADGQGSQGSGNQGM